MGKKTILVSLNHGIAVRNVLQTDVFKELRKKDINIVLLTPNANEKSFQSSFSFSNVYLEELKIESYREFLKSSKLQNILKTVRWFCLNTGTIRDWYEKVHKKERISKSLVYKLRNLVEDTLIALLLNYRVLQKLVTKLESLFFSPRFHQEIFDRYRPDYLLVTSLGFFDFDQFIMREARRNGVKIIAMILSWDNTSTRGIGTDSPDKVIAWTDIMKRELEELHDIPSEKIFVGGVPHFDHYYKEEFIYSKEKFLDRFNLVADRKIIYFATKSPTGYPWNPDIVELLAKAIKDGNFLYRCQLLVRLHPIHFRRVNGSYRFKKTFDRYESIAKKYDHVVINSPIMRTNAIAFDMPDSELHDVASILKHSDVIVNLFSTMNIEASIFDLPNVNVCFEGKSEVDNRLPRDNIKIDEAQDHNRRVVKTGGVRLAYTEEELIEFVNTYLQTPDRDKDGRFKILNNECGPYRGEAGGKVVEFIYDSIVTG